MRRRNREQAQKLVLIDALVMHIVFVLVLVFVFDNALGQYRTIGDKILKTWINHSLNLKHGSRDASTPKNNCIRKIMGSVKKRGKWENIFEKKLLPCGWTGHYTNAQCLLCKVRWYCIFYDAVSDTIRRRGGYRGIIMEERVDTVTYLGGNHGSRVWKSLKLKKVYFPHTWTSWDKYMCNRIVFFKF